jgi:hypothetical protein
VVALIIDVALATSERDGGPVYGAVHLIVVERAIWQRLPSISAVTLAGALVLDAPSYTRGEGIADDVAALNVRLTAEKRLARTTHAPQQRQGHKNSAAAPILPD